MSTAERQAPARVYEIVIGGMTCAACAARVERKLNAIEGVEASVNYATERAQVLAAPGLDPRVLVEQVGRAGYSARRIDDLARDEPPERDRVADLRRRLAVAAVLAVPVCDLSLALSLFPELRFPGWQWVCLLLAGPVVGWCAWPFHLAAARGLRHGVFSMDTLVSMGILAATGWSLWVMVRGGPVNPGIGQGLRVLSGGDHALYLEVAAGVTTFLLAGRYFEARAKRSASAAMRAMLELGAHDVEVLRDDGDDGAARVPITALLVDDRFVVRPGEKVATDAVVVDGTSALDTSMVTGEAVPREVGVGDAVVGGTVNRGGLLVLRATRVGADTHLARLTRLVERAQAGKASAQRFADRVASVFVPVVLALAAATLVGHLLLGSGAGPAVTAAVAVLVVACPCALGLATPTAILVGTGRGAQLGVFLKGPQALESTRRIDTVVFDKTGTLTDGVMSLVEVVAAPGVASDELLALAAAVEAGSEHPIAAAVTSSATKPLPLATDFAAVPGLGARAVVDGREVVVGRTGLLRERGWHLTVELAEAQEAWQAKGATVAVVGWDGAARGLLVLTDRVRPTSPAAVARLRGLGLRPILLTGDNARTAAAVGAEVGIDDVRAEVLPEGKADAVTALQAQGHAVAVVGDGVNDVAAIAVADLGMAVGRGTDAAIEAADVVLGRDDLLVVADAVRLARRTHTTIRVNLVWAFAYNVAALPLAMLGLLNPLIAGAAMSLSSVFVVAHSLRLRQFRPDER